MNTRHYYTTFSTTLGEFSLAVNESGAIVATAFGEVDALRKRFAADELIRDDSRTTNAQKEIEAYFAGERRDFSLALAPSGTAFQQRVWDELRAIPFGETRSYGALAKQLGSSPRAVGRANATNPICVIVPCHRVLGTDGALTGFAFGEPTKQRLLELEGALQPVG